MLEKAYTLVTIMLAISASTKDKKQTFCHKGSILPEQISLGERLDDKISCYESTSQNKRWISQQILYPFYDLKLSVEL